MKLESISLTSGEHITISPGVTAIVGPNNVGKSTILRELTTWFSSHPSQTAGIAAGMKAVSAPQIDFGASVDDFRSEIARALTARPPGVYPDGTYSEYSYRSKDGQVFTDGIINMVYGQPSMLQISSYFCLLLNADNRLNLASDSGAYDPWSASPSNPVQKLYADRELEKQLSTLTRRAFGMPIVVNRYGGSTIRIHVGSTVARETAAPPSLKYLDELNLLSPLSAQGDGFRAFVGMVLSVIAGSNPLVLIDEPEAFLHPPQARLFGEFLSQRHLSGTQVIVSTHSEDIIAGLTSGTNGPVSIVRLTRDGDGNHAAQLNAADVKELYTDPLIKYYNMLNGLFAPGVIVCEADTDCTYYRAVLDAQESVGDTRSGNHFTQCGGKARIHVAVSAFQAAKVPVAAIVDIDMLQNDNEFERLVSAAGGDAKLLEGMRNTVVSAIDAKSSKLSKTAAKAEVEKIFDSLKTEEITTAAAAKVNSAMKKSSSWREFKMSGRLYLSGGALQSFDSLVVALSALGIFLVTVGELERFHPDVPAGNKAEWLRTVLAEKRYENAPEANALLAAVLTFISSNQK
jgi:hypothetical protein